VAVGAAPYGRMLPDIRLVRLAVLRVDAKFKCRTSDTSSSRSRGSVPGANRSAASGVSEPASSPSPASHRLS
jgi:hypothetical protein